MGVHLRHCHGISPESYREKYGIPYTYGLCAADLRHQLSVARKLYYEDEENKANALKNLEELRKRPAKFPRMSHSASKTLVKRNQQYGPETDAIILKLREKDYSTSQISEMLDISKMTIARTIKRLKDS